MAKLGSVIKQKPIALRISGVYVQNLPAATFDRVLGNIEQEIKECQDMLQLVMNEIRDYQNDFMQLKNALRSSNIPKLVHVNVAITFYVKRTAFHVAIA